MCEIYTFQKIVKWRNAQNNSTNSKTFKKPECLLTISDLLSFIYTTRQGETPLPVRKTMFSYSNKILLFRERLLTHQKESFAKCFSNAFVCINYFTFHIYTLMLEDHNLPKDYSSQFLGSPVAEPERTELQLHPNEAFSLLYQQNREYKTLNTSRRKYYHFPPLIIFTY